MTRRRCAPATAIFYGPGQFEDRIQPIENFIERRRVQSTDVPGGALAYPVDPATYRNLLSVRGYTHDRPDEYNMQYGASISRELPGRDEPDRRLHRQQGPRHVPAGRREHVRQRHPGAAGPVGRPGRLQDLWLPRRPGHQREPHHGLRRGELRRAADRRSAPIPLRPDRRPELSVLAQRGHDAGLERGGDRRRTPSTTTPSSAPT